MKFLFWVLAIYLVSPSVWADIPVPSYSYYASIPLEPTEINILGLIAFTMVLLRILTSKKTEQTQMKKVLKGFLNIVKLFSIVLIYFFLSGIIAYGADPAINLFIAVVLCLFICFGISMIKKGICQIPVKNKYIKIILSCLVLLLNGLLIIVMGAGITIGLDKVNRYIKHDSYDRNITEYSDTLYDYD